MDELSTYQPFATATQFASWAQRALSPADTATVTQNLAAAASEIRRVCEWQVWPQLVDDVLTLDGPGGRLLRLPVSRLVAVASITQDGTELDADAYEWSRNGVVEANRWTSRRRGIVATVTHGFATCPPDLTLLNCQLAGRAGREARGPVNVERAGSVQLGYVVPQSGIMPSIELAAADLRRLSGYRGGYR